MQQNAWGGGGDYSFKNPSSKGMVGRMQDWIMGRK